MGIKGKKRYIYIYNHSAVLHAELLKNRKTGMQSQTVPGILRNGTLDWVKVDVFVIN